MSRYVMLWFKVSVWLLNKGLWIAGVGERFAEEIPQWSHDCITVVGNVSSKSVTEPKAKAALVWMLGEYAYDMLDAPYVLEGFVENWAEEESAEVHLIYSFLMLVPLPWQKIL
jgi:hypothetical protein